MTTQLIPKGELNEVLQQLLIKERAMLEAGEKALEFLMEGPIKQSLSSQLAKQREYVNALEAGFVPITIGGLLAVDTKDKWNKAKVKRIISTMPEVVRQAMKEAKETGLFKKISVTRGDPILVGIAGGKPFLIAAWVCCIGGQAVGFRFKR